MRHASRLLVCWAGAACIAAAPVQTLPLQDLPPQPMMSGDCALVLWTRSDQPRRILMILEGPARARLRLGGEVQDLPRVETEGPALSGQLSRQTFVGEGFTLALDMDVAARRTIPGGVALPDGVLDYRDAAGWSVVAPVGGVIACQP